MSCSVLEAFFSKVSALHPLPVHPIGTKIRGYLWQAPHSNPSFMTENIRRSCSWLIAYSTIIPSVPAAVSLSCVRFGLWYGTQGQDEAYKAVKGQWCWLTPLKTILKGFWWHIAVGPTNLLSHVFYKKWHDLTSFFLWNMWRGRRSCLPAGARPLIGSYSLSYREEQSLPSWFVFSFVWKCSLNYKHGCHLGNEKGKFVSFVS